MLGPEKRRDFLGDAINSLRSGRDSRLYNEKFGYTPSNLADKTILDVGSGDSNFAETARDAGARVVRLDADYRNVPPRDPHNAIGGLAQELPFQDEAFDEVVSYGSFLWVRGDEGLNAAVGEALRVTKEGGKVQVIPAKTDHMQELSPNIHIENNGAEPTLVIYKRNSDAQGLIGKARRYISRITD